jgi:hypothetical protein
MRDLDAARIPFRQQHVADRDLVLRMLKYEDALLLGKTASQMYLSALYLPRQSLTVEKTVQRIVLRAHGFDASPESAQNYRAIFRYYYRSPTDHDKNVLASVPYMRENKLLYYTSPEIQVGQCVSNQLAACSVHRCNDNEPPMSMLKAVHSMQCATVFVGAFSGS